MIDTKSILKQNTQKHKKIDIPYDPITGEGCVGERVRLVVTDAPCFIASEGLDTSSCTFYLPKDMVKEEIYQQLEEYGSVQKLFEALEIELNIDTYLAFWTTFCEIRIKYDFEYFAIAYQTIEDGDTGEDIPFKQKRGQRRFLEKLEEMRLAGVPIRIIILKARQMGLSTVTQLYMAWIQIVHKKNWHSVIAAHVKDSANTIRAMFNKVIENMPPIKGEKYTIGPFNNTHNIKIVHQTGCRITVGSAEAPESVRSQNPKLAHLSEIAFYPNTTKRGTSQLVGSIISPIKRVPMTMIVYESTANGVGDYFHSQWEKAKKGETAFEPIFLPWYFDDRYTEAIKGSYNNESGKKVQGDIIDFILSLTERELTLFTNCEECTLENLNWYRGKNAEMDTDELMMQEFPSDDIEAFQDSGLPAFRSQHIERMRARCKAPIAVGELIAEASATMFKMKDSDLKAILNDIHFVEDKEATQAMKSNDPKLRQRKSRDKLCVWDFPDTTQKVSDRYLVVFDPQKGISESADWGVITVFDRFGMMYGDKPEVVAQWKGRIDKDITIWIAAQIAKYYNDALLVVESNTYDSESKEDDAETIFNILAEYYNELYSRTPADKIKEGFPAKYGFNTNKSTKPMIRSTYVAVLREESYIERSSDALDEARVYEQKQNGSFGAKDGHHDDIIMTRMIGLHICFYEMPLPTIIKEEIVERRQRPVGESSF